MANRLTDNKHYKVFDTEGFFKGTTRVAVENSVKSASVILNKIGNKVAYFIPSGNPWMINASNTYLEDNLESNLENENEVSCEAEERNFQVINCSVENVEDNILAHDEMEKIFEEEAC